MNPPDPDPVVADDLVNFDVEIADQVARLGIHNAARGIQAGRIVDPHWELASILNGFRQREDVRVVVITGAEGAEYRVPSQLSRDVPFDPRWLWQISTGILEFHRAMAELDQPIIAKVNGDAIGLGASLVFCADLIVAREDARIADNHLGMGEVEPSVSAQGAVPGDGGVALMPLFLSPVRAKEYLMLAREYTARELERLGAINYAVPASELDGKVEELVKGLLRRPAYTLAWTKRVANRIVLDQLSRTLDAGVGYELVSLMFGRPSK